MIRISLLLILVTLLSLNTPSSGSKFYQWCQTNGRTISPTYQKANCVQFMDQALKKYYRINDPALTKSIYINYPLTVVAKALSDKDTSIVGGVAYGLVKAGRATWVAKKDLQRGDIVQYWTTTGYLNGHCGIFDKYDAVGNVMLVGSHPDSHGYGLMNCYDQNLTCTFFICRLK